MKSVTLYFAPYGVEYRWYAARGGRAVVIGANVPVVAAATPAAAYRALGLSDEPAAVQLSRQLGWRYLAPALHVELVLLTQRWCKGAIDSTEQDRLGRLVKAVCGLVNEHHAALAGGLLSAVQMNNPSEVRFDLGAFIPEAAE